MGWSEISTEENRVKMLLIVTLAIFALVAVGTLRVEDTTIEMVATSSAPEDPENAPAWWIHFEDTQGRPLVVNRADFDMTIGGYSYHGLISQDDWAMFRVLQKGQVVTLEQHAIGWRLFGTNIVLSERDRIRLKQDPQP